jgi:predicted RNA-binding protein with PIN domain
MNYIIDGYNLAFTIKTIAPVLKQGNTEKAIKQLIHFVRSVTGHNKSKIIIVFDGQDDLQPKKIKQGALEVLFSKKPQTADDIIRNLIRKKLQKDKWTVVSSDTEIIFTAKDHSVGTMRSEAFKNMKNKSSAKNSITTDNDKINPDNVDVDYWRSIFNNGKRNEE